MISSDPKICIIGLQKTGTTSIANALRKMGRSMGHATTRLAREVDWSMLDPTMQIEKIAVDVLAQNDGVSDSPYGFIYEAIDEAFPRTKFILSIRDTQSWLESYRTFFPDQNNRLRQWMFGVPTFRGHEEVYRDVFDNQNNAMRRYFAQRPADFLEMNLAEGDGWAKLTGFLGSEYLPFRHDNRQSKQ